MLYSLFVVFIFIFWLKYIKHLCKFACHWFSSLYIFFFF